MYCLAGADSCPAVIDTSHSGMSDVWGTAYAATGLAPDADTDGDGQSNYQESIAGTDPHDPQSVFRVTASELVNRAYLIRGRSVAGKPYQVEGTTSLFGSPWLPQGPPVSGSGGFVWSAIPIGPAPLMALRLRLPLDNPALAQARAALAGQDTDGDGYSDVDEYLAGTDPFDASSFVAVQSISLGSAVRLSWPSVAGKRYHVQSRTGNLTAPWQLEEGAFQGDGNVLIVTIPVTGNQQFFRVQVADADSDLDGVTDWEEHVTGLQFGPLIYRTNTPTATSAVAAILAATNLINLEVGTAVANVTRHTSGSFRVTRAGNLQRLTVRYVVSGRAVSGVDYAPLPGTVTLPMGVNEVEIPVTPLPGAVVTPAKSVVLTLLPDPTYALGTNVSRDVRVIKEVALSVRDFGALGDGVTDDTMAIQSAINALEASTNHNTLHFPAGTYRLNTATWVYDPLAYWIAHLLKLGNVDLAGRDLLFTGDPGATLFSTVSAFRTRMLVTYASFRSLTFRGLTWRKDGEPLPPTPGEPNGAEGVLLKYHDLRRVEAVDFVDCTFENCHGALLASGQGYDLRGRLAHFGFYRCQVLNPYGSNTRNGQLAYGGGQQVRLGPWVGFAEYRDNFFDGAGDKTHPRKNPGGIRKDGSHFGSPLRLLFANNVVRRMGVEAVFQTDEPYMGATAAAFTVPSSNGTSTAQATLHPVPSTYQVGQIINFRTWFNGVSPAVNVFLTVVAYDASNRLVTVRNQGLTAGMGGAVIPAQTPIYLQSYNPTLATIVGNVVDAGEAPGGASAITAIAKGTIVGNFTSGYGVGVYQYENVENPLYPPNAGLWIDSNLILTRDPSVEIYYTYGIQSAGPEDIISNNLIVTPATYRFIGVYALGADSWIESNTVIARQVVRQSYASNSRSVGIGIGNPSTGTTAVANRTYGFDVGIGPNPFQSPPHRVISHFSTNDVLAIDPNGLTEDFLP